jgi:hypothetical protein
MSANRNVIASAMEVAEGSNSEMIGELSEIHLSRSESALLIGAFLTLAVSMMTFTVL